MKSFAKRKGVTLFELLITVSVIVILAVGFFLSSYKTSSSADGARIIADLTNIKKAAMLWYADNYDKVKTMRANKQNIQAQRDILDEIRKYISGGSNLKLNPNNGNLLNEGTYGIFNVKGHRTTWYVGYRFAKDENNIRESIEGKADLLGLHFSSTWPNPNGYDAEKDTGEKRIVWMHVLGDLSDTSSSMSWN